MKSREGLCLYKQLPSYQYSLYSILRVRLFQNISKGKHVCVFLLLSANTTSLDGLRGVQLINSWKVYRIIFQTVYRV